MLGPAVARAQPAWRWVDEQGAVHFSQSREAIPERYRETAEPWTPKAPPAAGQPAPLPLRSQFVRIPSVSLSMDIIQDWAPGWNPDCSPGGYYRGTTPVRTSWDGEIRRIMVRLLATPEVRTDLGPHQVDLLVVVPGPNAPWGGAWACGATNSFEQTIIFTSTLLRAHSNAARFELGVGQTLAHELAHVAVHKFWHAAQIPAKAREHEADELGIYYFERAGYDCRLWQPKTHPHYANAPWSTPRILERVAAAKHVKAETLAKIAKHPHTPPELVDRLAHGRPREAKVAAAGNPNSPPETLAYLAASKVTKIRLAVATNPSTSVETLRDLWNKDIPIIRGAVERNPSCPPEITVARIFGQN